jgi:hypothetical protein
MVQSVGELTGPPKLGFSVFVFLILNTAFQSLVVR